MAKILPPLVLAALLASTASLQPQQPQAQPSLRARVRYAFPEPARVTVGLALDRFASGTPAAFDSIYPDPLGRFELASAVRGKATREGSLHRVIWANADTAVLLLTATVRSGDATGITTGSDETNEVRRFSGLYEALREGDTWLLRRQVPLDTGNYIHDQKLHVALTPGKQSEVVDTLAITVGNPYGFPVRLNNATRLASVQIDGRPVDYQFGGGVLWIDSPQRTHAQLVMTYSIPDQHEPPKPNTVPADTAPAYGALNNTDAWHPFFGYDSGNDLSPLSVTVTLPSEYILTTSVPQTVAVHDGTRTVYGESMHPQFLLALIYDRDWHPVTSMIGDLRFETFLTPKFPFSHDTLASIVGRVYHVLVPRFGEPQLPSHYLAVVDDRALGHGGFAVRMNNAVISGDHPLMLDEHVIGPSYTFAHEVSHGWTMNATGLGANFLQEGWATYAEGLVLGDVYGPATERAFWEKVRTSYTTGLDRAWLTEKYIPDVDGRVEGNRLIVTQAQPSALFDLAKLDVELVTPSGAVRRSIHLADRADTVKIGGLTGVTQVHVDPDHDYLLRRHWGEIVRFQLRAPDAKDGRVGR